MSLINQQAYSLHSIYGVPSAPQLLFRYIYYQVKKVKKVALPRTREGLTRLHTPDWRGMGGGGRRGAKRETGGLTARKGKKGWGGWGGVGSGRQQRSRAGDDERKKRISFLVFFWTICFIFIERDVALLEGPKGPSGIPGSGGAAVCTRTRSCADQSPFYPGVKVYSKVP